MTSDRLNIVESCSYSISGVRVINFLRSDLSVSFKVESDTNSFNENKLFLAWYLIEECPSMKEGCKMLILSVK